MLFSSTVPRSSNLIVLLAFLTVPIQYSCRSPLPEKYFLRKVHTRDGHETMKLDSGSRTPEIQDETETFALPAETMLVLTRRDRDETSLLPEM